MYNFVDKVDFLPLVGFQLDADLDFDTRRTGTRY